MHAQANIDWGLIQRYDTRGPRYTSYPTAVQFDDRFTSSHYEEQVALSNAAAHTKPLSGYVHIPFCEHLCFYCACNKIATKNRGRAERYLDSLLREIDLKAGLYSPNRTVEQLHFGGGTPTFLTTAQLSRILDALKNWFHFSDDSTGDYSIEIDPRTVDDEDMRALRELGFNRVSLGVQDFDEEVQRSVHRIQSQEETLGILNASREAGFRSINVDLIYGLPKQSLASMKETLSRILEAKPDRIALFNYAHLPDRFPAQRRIRDADLPGVTLKFEILKSSVEMMVDAGYVLIGMDHFALPDDTLVQARLNGTLQRSFQGYTTHANCELIDFGVSSIGRVGRCFSQNVYDIDSYQEQVGEARLPISKGILLDDDDVIRAHIIDQLMCFGSVNQLDVEEEFGINFKQYFGPELKKLGEFQDDELLTLNGERIVVTDRGWMLVRNICASFDRYLQSHQPDRFSKTI